MVAPTGAGADVNGDEGYEAVDIKGEEEILKVPAATSPVMPPPAVVEEHRLTHLTCRCWCRECVAGRGLGTQRGRHAGRQHDIPRIGVDYWYITTGGIKHRDELDYAKGAAGDEQINNDRAEGKIMKCIIVRCHESKAVFAHGI